MKFLWVFGIFFFRVPLAAQNISYSAIDMSPVVLRSYLKNETMVVLFNRNLQFLFDTYAGYYLNEKQSKKQREQVALLLHNIKEKFAGQPAFPDSMETGWHRVLLTDNKQFCRDAFVFVTANNIRRLVIDDCIPVECIAKGQVKDAKGFISVRDINIESEVLDVYFVNDMESNHLVAEPMTAGLVCFWSDKIKFLNERLLINGIHRDFISKLNANEPQCMEPGVLFYLMKPGIYYLRATTTGNDRESSFEVKPGMCPKYQLK